jgi:glycosyltransferase involved in cell wall biosynthesis
MPGCVTIAVPVYRRLAYLPQALASIAAQDYPAIELIVSDNGQNGDELRHIVELHYGRPFRLRRNEQSVSISAHFNQLLAEASGEYFVLLADDDAISPHFVSSLVARLEGQPEVGAALPRVETIDSAGGRRPGASRPNPPPLMSWQRFVESWAHDEYDYVVFATHLARTAEARAAGGYPEFPSGNYNDNALLLKLVLGRSVAYVPEATFLYRVYDTSAGLAASADALASASRLFMRFLEADADIAGFAHREPDAWRRARAQLIQVTWATYLARWSTLYRRRLTTRAWVRAAFLFPFVPAYYRRVLATLAYSWGPLAMLLSLRRRAASQL